MRARPLALGALASVMVVGCTDQGGVGGIVGGPVPTVEPAGTTTVPGGPTTTTGPTTTGRPPTPASTTSTSPGTSSPAGALRLGGNDLGVTRVGAPFREAVAAVSGVLGPPTGDPAPDSSCVGAEDETAWGPFRLAASRGQVSGWTSTSRTLATPAGVTVGTTLATLRQAYGTRLDVRLPNPDTGTIFVVTGADLGGGLSGQDASSTVTSLGNGTCQTA